MIYADTVADLGYADELGNYAEYSGAPNQQVIRPVKIICFCEQSVCYLQNCCVVSAQQLCSHEIACIPYTAMCAAGDVFVRQNIAWLCNVKL